MGEYDFSGHKRPLIVFRSATTGPEKIYLFFPADLRHSTAGGCYLHENWEKTTRKFYCFQEDSLIRTVKRLQALTSIRRGLKETGFRIVGVLKPLTKNSSGFASG